MKNITFINAGAGSGKTYRLTDELFKAIRAKECEANQVMFTTFTKKASDEIKIKAREKLLDEGLYKEAGDLQNAYIGTIHSVGQQIIQKFWHYIGFPKEIKVIDKDDTDFYFTQAIANIPSSDELKTLDELNYRFNLQNSSTNFYDSNRWQKDLLTIINEARTNNITDFSKSKKESIVYAEKCFNTDENLNIDKPFLTKLIDEIIKLGQALPEARNKGRITVAKELVEINKSNIKYSQLSKIHKAANKFSNHGLSQEDIEKAQKQLESYYRTKTLIDDIEKYNGLLFSLAEKSIEKYTEYKKDIGLIDYSDMENGFLQLLEIEEVKDEIRNTVKLVMVDEFQDSSPIQLAIFIKLSDIVNRSIWVGDPKQSIYGFRGTDPVLIDTIINEFDGGSAEGLLTSELEDSWRSRPDIVNIVNNIFKPALKDQIKEANIVLNPIRTNNGFEKPALHHFNLVEWKENKKNEKLKDSTKGAYYKAVAKSIVKMLNEDWTVSDKSKSKPNKDNPKKEIVVNRKMKASDIAILCKTHSSIEGISKELANFGIKFSTESKTLKKTAEFYLINALVKLIVAEQNTLAKAEILLFSDNDNVVKELIDERLSFLKDLPDQPTKPNTEGVDNPKEKMEAYFAKTKLYYERLNAWGAENLLIEGLSKIISEIKELPVPQLIEHIVNRLNIYTVISKLGNIEQRQRNIQKIIEYAYKYDDRCINMNLGASITGFIHYLQVQDNLTESISTSENSVNILTYHASKGLEWPVCVLADFNNNVDWAFIARNMFKIAIQNKENIDIKNILDDRNIISLPWVFGMLQSKPSEDFITNIQSLDEYEITKKAHDNELKRLLYVGMTRPRDYMITIGMSEQKKPNAKTRAYPWLDIVNKHDNWKFEDLADAETGTADIFDRGIEFQVNKLELSDDDKITIKESHKYFSDKNVNAERESEPYFISPSKVEDDSDVKVFLYANINNRISTGSSAEDRMADLGNCLHDILYLHIGNILSDTTENCIVGYQNIINNHNLTAIIPDVEQVKSSIDKLHEYLKNEFKPIEWYRELALEALINGQLYKGEADLVLETNDGYILIDYKSYPGRIESVLDAGLKNSADTKYAGKYAGQLNTYTKMIETVKEKKVLKKLIYYTVLGRLIEVE